ncbi:MAG TPA: hypothetical protein VGW76_11120 [Pyrinomonadaceae bacterium]|nr:hypothetical protein [Pyrinomonadaceae bacterium]
MSQEASLLGTDEKHVCLNSLKVSWAQAQIEAPMHAVARYDDVAKLLITIGGFVLAVLAGAYSAMLKDLQGVDLSQAKSASRWILISMLVFFVSAAAVCYRQPKMWVKQIIRAENDDALENSIDRWCDNINGVVLTKKILLIIATVAFVISFLVMMWLLMTLLGLPRP